MKLRGHRTIRLFHPRRSMPAAATYLRRPPTPDSRGLTLLEVLLSLAILVVCMAALGRLISTGVRGAVQTRLQSEAVIRAESKMAELVAGIETLEEVQGAAFEDDAEWVWDAAVLPGPTVDLYLVEVTVRHALGGGGQEISFTLPRYVRDPQVMLDALYAEQSESGTTSGGGGT